MKPTKILIVEDEIIVAEDIAGRLRKLGYAVAGLVDSGEQAMQKVAETQPNLILMDIVLKGNIDGIAAASQIKNQFNIPSVFLTAYADEKTLERAKQTNPFGYIVKPFQQKDLRATIEIALERHRAEMQILRSLETAERQRQLAEEKAARQSQYVSIVAHELRNPLSAISTATDILELTQGNASYTGQQKTLRAMQSATNNMKQLIDDMLLIGKAESGKLELNRDLLDLEDFCTILIEQMELMAGENHHITWKISGFLKVVVDAQVLQKIIANLLANAIKYSPQGGEISLEIESLKSCLIIRVIDSGLGIAQEEQDKVFEAFYRSPHTRRIKGAGLGLTIVKKAVELYRGEIELKSKLGLGTTFSITLPLQA